MVAYAARARCGQKEVSLPRIYCCEVVVVIPARVLLRGGEGENVVEKHIGQRAERLAGGARSIPHEQHRKDPFLKLRLEEVVALLLPDFGEAAEGHPRVDDAVVALVIEAGQLRRIRRAVREEEAIEGLGALRAIDEFRVRGPRERQQPVGPRVARVDAPVPHREVVPGREVEVFPVRALGRRQSRTVRRRRPVAAAAVRFAVRVDDQHLAFQREGGDGRGRGGGGRAGEGSDRRVATGPARTTATRLFCGRRRVALSLAFLGHGLSCVLRPLTHSIS